MIRYFFSILICVLITQVHALGQDEDWIFRLEKEGITVYTHKSENSDLESFKGSITIESSLSAIVALLQDIGNYNKWMYKTKEARLLKWEENTMYIYTVSEAPWPVSPRDNISFSRLVQNPDTKEVLISIKAIPDFLPKKQGYVRIPEALGSWRLVPLSGGKVQVSYQMKTDSGGSLPSWMANLAVTQAPLHMLKHLREEVKKPLYRDAKIKGLIEAR